MKLLEMNTLDFQEYMGKNDAVIIPSGAYEIWGPHLPVGADTIIAEEMAFRLGDRMGWLVGPTVPVGDSLFSWGPGAVTARPDSFRDYLEDICMSLVKHGMKRFCFLNPHVGNVPLISQVAAKLKIEQGALCCLFDWWRFIQPLCSEEKILDSDGIMSHGHASEAGTSLFLYLRPDLVRTDRLIRTEPKKVNAVGRRSFGETETNLCCAGCLTSRLVMSERESRKKKKPLMNCNQWLLFIFTNTLNKRLGRFAGSFFFQSGHGPVRRGDRGLPNDFVHPAVHQAHPVFP